jgi:outer membrane murein-binding lipoprotein Lpp
MWLNLTKAQKTVLIEALIVLAVTLFLALMTGCGPHKYTPYDSTRDDEQDSRIGELERRITAMGTAYSALAAQVTALSEDADSSASEVASLQTSANLLAAQIAALQANVLIHEIVDPCGDGPGFDEVLLRTSSGYMGYFEAGNNRFLALIPAGSYHLTDQSACPFIITPNGTLTY